MILHVVDDALTHANRRTRHWEHPPATWREVLDAARGLLGLPEGPLVCLLNGAPAEEAWLTDEEDVGGAVLGRAPGAADVLTVAPRHGDVVDVVLIGIALLSAAASAVLVSNIKLPAIAGSEESVEKRLGFGRIAELAFAGDTIPVIMGAPPRVGGRVVARVPGEGAAGEGDSRLKLLICLGHGPIRSIAGRTSDFDGVDAASIDGVYLNDQPIASFPGCRVSGRLGSAGQAVIPGFADTEVLSEVGAGGVSLVNTSGSERTGGSASGEAYTFTTLGEVDAVVVRVRLPQGLFTLEGSQLDARQVKYRVRTRTADTGGGAGAWSDWTVITVTGAEQSELFSSPRLDNLAGGRDVYDVQAERVTTDADDVGTHDVLVWDSVVEVQYSANRYPSMAMLALELIASEQLAGVPDVSVEVEGIKARVWDGVSDPSSPVWSTEHTANPAYLALELLTNGVWGMGLDDSVIDTASLIAWAEICDESVDRPGGGTRPRYRCHLNIAEPRSPYDWLKVLCDAGRCTPVTSGLLWRFVPAAVKPTPVEIFTDGSVAADDAGVPQISYRRRYTEGGYTVPNQLVAQFVSEAGAGEPEVIKYPEDGALWLAGEDARPQDVVIEGVTDLDQIAAQLVYLAKRARGLSREVEFVTTRPVVAVQPGERFDLALGVMGWGLASGRVRRGTTASALILDRDITLAAGQTYHAQVVHLDGSAESGVIAAPAGAYPAGTAIALAAALAQTPAEGAEYSVGAVGVVTKPFECTSVTVEDAATLRWRVGGIEYSADTYDDTVSEVTFPEYSTLRTNLTPPGPVRNLKAYERTNSQTGERFVELSWRQAPEDSEITGSFRVYRRRVGLPGWVLVQDARVARRAAVLELASTDVAYEFVVVAVSHAGLHLSPDDPSLPIASLVLGLAADPPPAPASLTATRTSGNLYTLSWPAVSGAVEYQVLFNGGSGDTRDAVVLRRVTGTSVAGLALAPQLAESFWVRSVGQNRRMSFTAAGTSVALPPPPVGKSIKDTQSFLPWSVGTLSNLTADGSTLKLTNPNNPGVWTSPEVHTGTVTVCELDFRLQALNDVDDPLVSTDPFAIPSLGADQWSVLSSGPAVIGMHMPPYPDSETTWAVEVRTYDGSVWGDWETLSPFVPLVRAMEGYQVRVTMARQNAPYRPALGAQFNVVLSH